MEVAPVQQKGKNMGKKKKHKCTTCGAPLILIKEKIYTAIVGGSMLMAGDKYSAIDCEICGCQNLLAIRYPEAKREMEEKH